jgi:predicted O-methyltransferase YrrM
MRIGRRKTIAAVGLVIGCAIALAGWILWGTDGLLAATLIILLVGLMAVGWFVAQSERHIRSVVMGQRGDQSRAIEEIRAVSDRLQDAAGLIKGASGDQAERLLKAVQAGFLRSEHTLDTLVSEWQSSREQLLSSMLQALEREVGSVGREVGLVSREMDLATRRIDSAMEAVSQTEKIFKELRPTLKTVVEDQNSLLYRQFEALAALYLDIRPETALPPTRFFAASPDLLLTLYRLIRERKSSLVVECGSGASTIVMAYAMKANGFGKVVALEHLASYKSLTEEFASEHGLSEWVEVVHAPLRSTSLEDEEWVWYSTDRLPSGQIDLLVVDGPPSWVGSKSRYPAVPVLEDRLSADAIVILDDYRRREESEIGELWLARHPEWSMNVIGHEKGTALFGKEPPHGPATHITLRKTEGATD